MVRGHASRGVSPGVRTVLFSLAGLAVLAAAGMLWAYARTDTYLGRWFAWRASDVGDVARFPARHIAASSEPRPLPETFTAEERDAYRQLMTALAVTGESLNIVREKINGTKED